MVSQEATLFCRKSFQLQLKLQVQKKKFDRHLLTTFVGQIQDSQ